MNERPRKHQIQPNAEQLETAAQELLSVADRVATNKMHQEQPQLWLDLKRARDRVRMALQRA